MPTDLPPDYKPAATPPTGPGAVPDPATPAAGVAPVRNPDGADVVIPGPAGDVVDQPGRNEPGSPGDQVGIPAPAGMPSF